MRQVDKASRVIRQLPSEAQVKTTFLSICVFMEKMERIFRFLGYSIMVMVDNDDTDGGQKCHV